MTQPFLSPPNSGLRVFSACLLSVLMIMMPFVQMAAAEGQRSEVRGQRSESGRQTADSRQQDTAKNAAAENVFLNAPIPKPAPEPPAPLAVGPVIVATMDDGLATTVAPGGTITYTVNIQNNGATSPADDALNVLFTNQIDAHTTLVADSTVAAVSDKYNTIGNTQISVPDGSTDLLGNDLDPDPPASGTNAGMTVTGYGATTGTEQTVMGTATATAQGGSVTVNANGSFTYDPATGFEGTDTFKYRAADADGFTAITTVQITVSGIIWYIDNNATSCTTLAAGCGTLSKPFSDLPSFQAVNDGAAGPPQHPKAGDNIFLFESATDYVGPVTLLNNQRFIGQDASESMTTITGLTAPSGTDPFPVMNSGNGTIVNITSASNDVNLGQGNTLRGFTAGNATGTAINGATFGTLTVGGSAPGDVTINSTGRALALNTGTANGNFKAISSSGGANGIALTSCAGTLAIAGGTLTGASGDEFLIDGNTPTINVTYSGNITYAGTGSAIRVTASTGIHTGNLTFDTGTLSVTGGIGINIVTQFGTSNFYTTSGSANINGAASGIILGVNSNGAYNFGQDGTPTSFVINNTTGTSFNVNNTAADVTYNGNITQTANNATLVSMTSLNASGFVSFDNNGTLSATNGNGIQLTDADGPVSFNGTTTLNGADAGVDILNGSGGTITFSSNATITSPNAGPAFNVSGSPANNGNYTYSGNITQNNAQRVVNIDGMTGVATFNTGTVVGGASSTGLNINNTNGTVTFSNGITLGTAGSRMTNQAVTMTNGVGTGAGTYNLGAVSIFTNNAAGIVAIDIDGTINSTSGTVDSTGARAIRIDGPAGITTLGMTLTTVNSTGGTNNVELTDLGGSLTANGGALSGASGVSFAVTNSTLNISISASISKTSAGRLVDFDNYDTGTATISGALTCNTSCGGVEVTNNGASSGTVNFSGATKTLNTSDSVAVNLDNNDGGTVNFNGGGLDIDTTTATGFNAINGGTVNVTTGANNNTINSTTGTAFNGNAVTLGASGVTFRSISSSGGTNGIILNDTSGNFTVTGDGLGRANGSGGTISNITGGVIGNAPVYLFSAAGTISLSSISMSLNTNAFSGMLVDNNSGNDTIVVNVTGCTFTGVTASVVQNKSLLQFEAGGSANLTANVQNSFFNSSRTYGMFATGAGTSIVNVTLNQSGFGTDVNTGAAVNQPGTTITNAPAFGLGIGNGSSAQVDYNVTQNTFWGADGLLGAIYAVTISGATTTPSSHLEGFITGNKIGKSGTVGSGCSNGCAGIGLLPGTQGTFNASVSSNDIRQVNAQGINFFNSVSGSSGTSIGHFTNNTITEPDTTGAPLFLRGIVVSSGNSGGSTANWCAEVTGNNISGAWQAGNFVRITTLNTTGILTIPGVTPLAGATGPQVDTYIEGANTIGAGNSNTTIGGAINGSASPCAAPLLLAEGGVDAISFLSALSDLATNASAHRHSDATFSQMTAKAETVSSLDQAQLDGIVAAATQRWIATGLTQQQIAAMRELRFEVGDLANSFLGEASGNRIVVDRNAQGKGWFIDTTPADDLEFGDRSSATRRYTNPFTSAAGRIDLLTAIEHEIGHKLGLDDSYAEKDRDSIMYGYLTVGERRMPARGEAANAQTGSLAGTHFLTLKDRGGKVESSRQKAASGKHHNGTARALTAPMLVDTVTANIGTLPAGGSVTITYQVTVNNPPNLTLLNPPRVSNQGTVSGSNFTLVNGTATTPNTDDPTVGGATDPTETLIDLFDLTNSLACTPDPSGNGQQVTCTATLTENSPQAVDPNSTVDFIDTSNANAVICDDVAISGAAGGPYTALCQTSALTVGPHNLRADYSGDGNFDASQSATYAQDVLNCVTNPIVTTTADSGAGSLREAMMNVCAAPNNVITFNIDPGTGPHTIQLASVLPAIAASVDITNTSGESITVSGEGAADPYRIFKINSGQTVNISNLTITNGAPDGAAVFPANVGGGILNEGTLTLTGCTVSGNTVTSIGGGGIYNYLPGATLNLVNSTVSGNHATVTSAGGGIHNNGGNVSLTDSTVSGNDAAADGGGINNGTGTLTVTGSTVSGNTANFGGGIQNFGTLTLTNSTISSNNANTDGGGLYINATGATFTSVTFSNNRADNDSNATGTGGGMFVFAGTPTLNNTIVAGNFNENNPAADTADDIAGPGIVNATSSFNLIGTGGAGGLTTTGAPTHNQVGVASPGLGLLLNNGGPTFTHALLTGSPAIDKGDDFSLVPTTDQRGQTRPVDTPSVVDTSDGSDIGAFEKGFSPIPAVTTTAGNLSYAENDPATAIDPGLTVTDDDSANLVDASASITTNFQAGQDVLSWIDNNALDSITLNVGSSTAQTIVLTGTDTLANYEAALRAVTYQNTSDNPSTLTRTVTFTVNDDTYAGSGTRDIAVSASNDNPTITSNGSGPTASVNAVENQTAVTTVTSTDPDGGTPGYSIIGGADMGVFSIGSLSGVLTFNSAPNFEAPTDVGANNVYEVTVQVSDGNSGIDTQAISVTVTNVNEAPVITSDGGGPTANVNAEENQTAVTTVMSTDVDGGTPSYSISGGADMGAFSIGSSSGVLTFNSAPNFESPTDAGANNVYEVEVQVSDGNSGTDTQAISVTVTNVNEAPVNTVPTTQGTNLDTPLTFSSGSGNQISVTDVDAGSADIRITLTATNGTITLGSIPAGLSFGAGDGTADTTMTFDGTLTEVNTAMNGMSFNPTAGFSGAATLTITSNDLGNTGTGGAQSDGPDTVNIQVATNLKINDASVPEPASPNTTNMVFTVSLSAPAPGLVTVNFTTQDEPVGVGKAVAGQDYTSTNGTVTFTAGQQVKTIHVPILSDNTPEPDETFLVQLSGESGATLVDGTATGTIKAANTAGTLLISEFRQFGPGPGNDPLDDFVEIYNNTNAPITVPAGGYGLFRVASTCSVTDQPQLIGTIPAGTVIPARGHFLFTGPIANYSLKDYGGTNAAVNNALLTVDLGANENFGLFATADVSQISSVNRFDAVGFGINDQNACDLLREGTLLPALTVSPSLGQHSYFRKMCDWIQHQGCTVPGIPKDTNNNSDDFWLADTTASVITGRLGAPGPENLASPIRRDNANNPLPGGINVFLLDSTIGPAAGANRDRNSLEGAGSTPTQFGTMTLRYRVTNNTGAPVTRLRYRIVDISTHLQSGGPTADLRAITGTDHAAGPVHDTVTCTADGQPAPPPGCTVTVKATTLETPPAQAIGGGYNSTLSSGTITTLTPLPNGQSILINFKLGVQKTGAFRVFVTVEALP